MKLFTLILFLITSFANRTDHYTECNKLELCLQTKEFQEFVHFNKIPDVEVVLYDATGLVYKCADFNIAGKTFIIKRPDFKVEINDSPVAGSEKLVLLKAERSKKVIRFTFFLSVSNATLEMEINGDNEIKVVSKGAY